MVTGTVLSLGAVNLTEANGEDVGGRVSSTAAVTR